MSNYNNLVETFLYNNNLNYMTCAELTDYETVISDIQSQINDIINLYPGSTIDEVLNFLAKNTNTNPSDQITLKKHYYKLLFLQKKLNEIEDLRGENDQFVSLSPKSTPAYPLSVQGTYDCDEDNSISKIIVKGAKKGDITLILNDAGSIQQGDNLYIGEEQNIVNNINQNIITLKKPLKLNYSSNTQIKINNFVLQTNNKGGPICKNLKTGEESPVKVLCPNNFKAIDLRCYNA
jgi:hypothetical protein